MRDRSQEGIGGWAAAAAFWLLLASCAPAGGGDAGAPGNPAPGKPASGDVVLENVHGGTTRWSEFDGKIRIVNFWATWCPPCTVEIPNLNELAEEYRDRGVEIIGVSLDDDAELVRDFEREIPLNYPSLMNAPILQEKYGTILGVPFTVILDRSGQVFNTYTGFTHPKWFREDLADLLARDGP